MNNLVIMIEDTDSFYSSFNNDKYLIVNIQHKRCLRYITDN